jgi:SAM-dependent methyltransferase
MKTAWQRMEASATPSWYLHPLVAQQKHDVHLAWVRRWRPRHAAGPLLKTDLFEDAYGSDTLLPALLDDATVVIGCDRLPGVVRRARGRFPAATFRALAADCGALPLAPASVTTVLSLSTLDHGASPADFSAALAEIARVLEPGGLLLITLDNPGNPLYWVLRAISRLGWTPFPLGYTPGRFVLDRQLEAVGFEVLGRDVLIHNPRVLSTALFIGLQRLLGRRADPLVAWLLAGFAQLGRLPTRGLSACFTATCARKRGAVHPSPLSTTGFP